MLLLKKKLHHSAQVHPLAWDQSPCRGQGAPSKVA
jgi:hypothetical protein